MKMMMDDVYGADTQNGAKEAANAKEAGHVSIEYGVNVRTNDNLVGEHQIRNTDQYGECDFADQKEHYEQLHSLFYVLWSSKQ